MDITLGDVIEYLEVNRKDHSLYIGHDIYLFIPSGTYYSSDLTITNGRVFKDDNLVGLCKGLIEGPNQLTQEKREYLENNMLNPKTVLKLLIDLNLCHNSHILEYDIIENIKSISETYDIDFDLAECILEEIQEHSSIVINHEICVNMMDDTGSIKYSYNLLGLNVLMSGILKELQEGFDLSKVEGQYEFYSMLGNFPTKSANK